MTHKFKLGEKVMADIAAPRNAESFGSLLLYKIIGRIIKEDSAGIGLFYYVRQVNVRDGTIHGIMEIEEDSLKSVDEYNASLKDK